MDLEDWEESLSFDGRPVKLGIDSQWECDYLCLDVYDVILGIKQGGRCPDETPRPMHHHEICFKFGGKMIRIVYIESYSVSENCECIFVKHVGVAK